LNEETFYRMQLFLARVFSVVAVVLMSGVEAKEMAVDEKVAAELYDSGIIHHRIMDQKHVSFFHLLIECVDDSDRRLGRDQDNLER
jgi:hypothetical protein